ncbi:MAG TPA: alpha/beta hydrolase [Thermoplasmata archaeon]|nr:alpha/beta hydrolase [Thermoplasmata archaeon]
MAPRSAAPSAGRADAWSDPAAHENRFVHVNGVRLNYLDWGGSGPALIFLHGAGSNPHYFDDLAPAFTGRFRVLAYARRGHARSEAKGPYDTATLTEDLRGLMDAVGISKAHLAGHSMGGNEITRFAGTYPDRVDRLVYLDAAYDMGDPAFLTAMRPMPSFMRAGTPASALVSLDAYRARCAAQLPGVRDTGGFEAWIREDVEARPDGTVRLKEFEGVSPAFMAALTEPRDYTRVRAPALVVYSASFGNTHHGDPAEVAATLEWNQRYVAPLRAAAEERVRRELHDVKVLHVPGTHDDLVFTCRKQLVAAMGQFLRLK